MTTFRYEDIPADMTVLEYIRANSDWDEQVSKFPQRYEPDLSVENMKVDARVIEGELAKFFHSVGGVKPWQSRPEKNTSIRGGALTYNPTYPEDQWPLCGFGHPRYQNIDTTTYFTKVNGDKDVVPKDDYLDIHTFRKVHPNVIRNCPTLTAFFNNFKLPLVNVTSRTVYGPFAQPTRFSTPEGGMHVDHTPFEAMRVNLMVSTNGDFGLEYNRGDIVFPGPGENIVVNTDVMHRVHTRDWNLSNRTTLVMSVLPWLDYDWMDDSWSFNEYYGQIHPYDMVKEGLIYG